MTADISSLYQGTGEQEASFPEILPVSVPSLHINDVLGSRAEQARPWRVGLVSLPARGGGALVVLPPCSPPAPHPALWLHPSCIFVWRLSSEMTISMRQRLAELRQRQRGGKQQGSSSPQRAAGPNR